MNDGIHEEGRGFGTVPVDVDFTILPSANGIDVRQVQQEIQDALVGSLGMPPSYLINNESTRTEMAARALEYGTSLYKAMAGVGDTISSFSVQSAEVSTKYRLDKHGYVYFTYLNMLVGTRAERIIPDRRNRQGPHVPRRTVHKWAKKQLGIVSAVTACQPIKPIEFINIKFEVSPSYENGFEVSAVAGPDPDRPLTEDERRLFENQATWKNTSAGRLNSKEPNHSSVEGRGDNNAGDPERPVGEGSTREDGSR